MIEQSLQRLGFSTPTPVQEAMREGVLAGQDVLALAPTGTGKTLAFGVPILSRLINEPPAMRSGARRTKYIDPHDRLRAVVLSPTRELAQQVAKDLEAAAKGSMMRVAVVFGKSPAAPQREAIKAGPDILVGTPGRIREFVDEGSLSLAGIKIVVIDEADRMADMGFLPQVETILAWIPTPRQVVCVSATLPTSTEKRVSALMHQPLRVEIGRRNAPISENHARFTIDDGDKVALLLALLRRPTSGGTAVYVRTRRRAGWVAGALERHAFKTALLHGDRSQRSRDMALADFAQGRASVLVATDVASRGLHIERMTRVINYDVPLMPEDFVHRVGRAGHGGGSAESITFVAPDERAEWARVENLVGSEIREETLPDFSEFSRRPSGGGQQAKQSPKPKRTQHRKLKKALSKGAEWRGKKATRESVKPLDRGSKPGRGVRSAGR